MTSSSVRRTKRLFVLADPSEFRRDLVGHLDRIGYEYDVCTSWSEATPQLDERFYHLGIVDLQLISESDREPIRGLRNIVSRRALPIFILKEDMPSAAEMVHFMCDGVVGAMTQGAPLEETVYRIESYLSFRDPNHFVRPPRLDFPEPVRMSSFENPKRPAEVSLGCNLSRTGILVSTWSPPESGDRIWIEFNLPEIGRPIECLGEVARLMPSEDGPTAAGIAFVDLPDFEEKMLTKHVLAGLRASAA